MYKLRHLSYFIYVWFEIGKDSNESSIITYPVKDMHYTVIAYFECTIYYLILLIPFKTRLSLLTKFNNLITDCYKQCRRYVILPIKQGI